MKIGIDISQIVYQGTGVARFTQGLVDAILQYDKKNQWLFLFSSLRRNLNQDLENKILNKKHKLVKWKLPPTLLSFFWNNLHQFSKSFMFYVSYFNDLDWFISSDWSEPPLEINKTTIVHDLVYLRYPETVNKKIMSTQQKRLFWVKKESKIIFADSQSTKEDLVNFLHIDSNKIVVNYPGVSILNKKGLKKENILKKFNLRQPFILTVGKLEPRKNLNLLVQSFKQLNQPKVSLVIVGPKGWDKISENLNRKSLPSNIKFLGYISDEDLYSLYSSSLFFIYPSIWEGFGYPLIEAMKLGAPVACSNSSSLKEIAGNAALFFDPYDINDITEKIKIMIENKKLREQLIVKGKKRSEKFTWQVYYKKLIETLYGYRG